MYRLPTVRFCYISRSYSAWCHAHTQTLPFPGPHSYLPQGASESVSGKWLSCESLFQGLLLGHPVLGNQHHWQILEPVRLQASSTSELSGALLPAGHTLINNSYICARYYASYLIYINSVLTVTLWGRYSYLHFQMKKQRTREVKRLPKVPHTINSRMNSNLGNLALGVRVCLCVLSRLVMSDSLWPHGR